MALIRCGGGGGSTPKKAEYLVPIMNSFSQSGYIVTSYPTYGGNMSAPYRVFNRNWKGNESDWSYRGFENAVQSTYVQIELPTPQVATHILIGTSYRGSAYNLRTGQVLGSKDGTNFTMLKEFTMPNYDYGYSQIFEIDSDAIDAYKYYRIKAVRNFAFDNHNLDIGEFDLIYGDPRDFLFKDGDLKTESIPITTNNVDNIPLDTNSHAYTSDRPGREVFEKNDIGFFGSFPSSLGTRTLVTAQPMNASEIGSVHIEFTAGNEKFELSTSVTDYTGLFYPIFSLLTDGGGRWYYGLYLVNELENFGYKTLIKSTQIEKYWTEKRDVTVTKFWAEKKFAKPTNKQAVIWDNTGYAYKSDWYTNGGWKINNGIMSAVVPTVASSDKSIVTNDTIDFNGYSKLKAEYTFANESGTFVIDVTDLSNAYVMFSFMFDSSGKDYLEMYVSNSKQFHSNQHLKTANKNNSAHTNGIVASISRIWLEK